MKILINKTGIERKHVNYKRGAVNTVGCFMFLKAKKELSSAF